MAGRAANASNGRRIIYCIVPRDLAAKLHEPLRRHFQGDPSVEVIVERRAGERRQAGERRSGPQAAPKGERRRVRSRSGRRAGARRSTTVSVASPPLPRKARPCADRLVFVERLEPSSQRAEDRDTARLVARIQAGESERFGDLYTRYFDRVYRYLRVVLNDADEAEDATQQVFVNVLEALPRYEARGPFRAWLFTIVRNYALRQLQGRSRSQLVVDPADLDRRRECAQDADDELPVLEWITDRELMMFVERLPLAQRQVLLLRYALDLTNTEIAPILKRSPNDIAVLQRRALRFLHARLTALGRGPSQGVREGSIRWVPHNRVLRRRRFALFS